MISKVQQQLNTIQADNSPMKRAAGNSSSSSSSRNNKRAAAADDGNTRRSLTSAMGSLAAQSAEWAKLLSQTKASDVEGTLPLSKKEFQSVIVQLESELRALAEATEEELDLVL